MAAERCACDEDIYPTETDRKENTSTRIDRRKGRKEMKKEQLYRNQHKQNMEVMKGIHTELKRTYNILQEAADQKKDRSDTEKIYMAL